MNYKIAKLVKIKLKKINVILANGNIFHDFNIDSQKKANIIKEFLDIHKE